MSRTISRWTMAGALALAAVGVIGGFTPGVTTAEAAPSVNQFAGSWSGTWLAVEIEVVGTYDWTISDAGRIDGTLSNTTLGGGGTMVGHVGADGNLMMIGMAPNDAPDTGTNGFSFQGTAVIDGDGKLVVSVTRTDSSGGSLVAILERN